MNMDFWTEPVLKLAHFPGEFVSETTKSWLDKDDNCCAREIGTRVLNVGIVLGLAIATVANLVCLIFESLAKIFSAIGKNCSESIKEWDEKVDPEVVAKITLCTLGLLASSAVVGWFSPRAIFAIEKWMVKQNDD